MLRFVALGDTGTANDGQYAVADAIREKCTRDGCDFAVLLGDNVYPSGVTSATDPDWGPRVADAYEPLGIPFYAVLGNHDYGGEGSGGDYTLGKHQVEYSALHEWFIMPAEWFAFDAGPASFLATGTNLINRRDDSLAEQTQYFRDAVAASDRPWKISLGHHPYVSNGPHGNAGDYDGTSGRGWRVKQFFEEALCGEVDLHLSGHDHSLQALPGNQACPGLFVVSGAGSSGTSLPGSNAALFQNRELGFAWIQVSDSTLVVEFVNVDGETLFTHTLTR